MSKHNYQTEESRFMALLEGREDAFADYFHLWFPALCVYGEKMMGHRELAEDVAQESLIKLWQNRKLIKNPDHLKNFLYQVTKNKCIDLLRERKSGKTVLSGVNSTAFPDTTDEKNALYNLIQSETIRQLSLVISQLPVRQRTVFQLTVVEGKKYQEAAQIMSIDPETVRHHRHTSLKSVRKSLGHLGLDTEI